MRSEHRQQHANSREFARLWRRIELRDTIWTTPACSALASPSLTTSPVAHAPITGFRAIPGTVRC